MKQKAESVTWFSLALAAAVCLVAGQPALAGGKMSVLEGLVRTAIEEGRGELKAGTKLAEDARLLRGGEELFENAARQHEALLRSVGRIAELDEPTLAKRLTQLTARADSETVQTLAQMSMAERRFVVEAAETAGTLSRKFPNEASEMVRRLGPEGLSYTRVYGAEVAEVVLKEGPESIGVIRKGGRGAWAFFTDSVLPHKKKLAAAGVLAAFLASPDKFVDVTGRVTDYAVREFARAGVELASSLPSAVTGGIQVGVDRVLDRWGMNYAPLRWSAVAFLLVLAATATMRLVGWPVRSLFWPFKFAARLVRGSTSS
jgi:hypothetical protein